MDDIDKTNGFVPYILKIHWDHSSSRSVVSHEITVFYQHQLHILFHLSKFL